MTVVNTASCFEFARRVDPKCSHYKEKVQFERKLTLKVFYYSTKVNEGI